MSSRTKKAALGVAIIGAMFGVGIAFAAWTANGTGSGYAKAITAQAVATNDVSATVTADLYPGADGDVTVSINNPNPYPINVSQINGNGAITSSSVTCVTTGVTYTNQSEPSADAWDIAANDTEVFVLTDAAHMSNLSDPGCSGSTFTVPVSIVAASDA